LQQKKYIFTNNVAGVFCMSMGFFYDPPKLRPAVRRTTVAEPQAESPPIIRHYQMPLVTSAHFCGTEPARS
jgi:hypothetical protein